MTGSSEGRAFFTIVSANYISYAATLMQSLRERHPGAARYIVLADAYRDFPDLDLAADVMLCDRLDIALIDNMRLWYTITEFNTAIKPFAFRYLFDKLACKDVCYLDPDILVFEPLTEVFAALEEHSCVLTPHITQPLQDGKEPSDLTIMKSGVYNLGFLGLRNDADARRFLDWWSERCVAQSRVDIAGNMFTDQRWMDLAPSFLEKHHILRHPGYNVAYWNLAHRQVEKRQDGQWQVNGRPLVFFHFSGINIDDSKSFSRHQNRFTVDDMGAVGGLCEQYRALVRSNGWTRYRSLRYGFGSFANGRPIEEPMRRWILRAIDDERLSATDPLALHPNFFDAADETAAARGVTLTRAMYQFWLDRDDLRTVFDIYTPEGLDSYYNWFTSGDAEADGLDGRTIAAAKALRGGPTRSMSASRRRQEPPWEPVSAESWRGAAAEAGELLHSDVAFTIDNTRMLLPRQAALMWELRDDLRAAYGLADSNSVHEYTAWAVSSGMAEQAIEPRLLTEEFVEQLARISRISLYYNDVPLTEGMLITRGVGVGRDYLDGWRRFPADRHGRLAHGIWYAFIAPKLFRWPAAVAEPTKRYFAELTDVSCAGFRINRGAMALWELRSDLQRSFPLSDPNSCWRYLHWLVLDGLRELKLTLDEFDPRLRPFLTRESPRVPGVPQILEMIRESRLDLQNAFDTGTEAGRAGLLDWGRHHFRQSYAGTPAELLYPPQPEERPDDAEAADPARLVHHASIGLTGQWTAPSGRGEDVRMAAQALQTAGFTDFLVIDSDSGRVLRADGSALPEGGRVELGVNIVYLNADTAFRDWRFLRQARVGARKSIGFWAWELDRLPRQWLHAFSFHDEIWAATEFARAAFAREDRRPVKLVPLAVSVAQFERKRSRAELGLPEDATVFLFVFDFRSYASRKNPEAVVQAFLRAFPKGNENASLLIKTQGGAAAADAWWSLNEACSDPRIEIRDANLAREELLALIDATDAFVSLHRSEGFGRGPAEAMLLGKPVILTGFSGTADFATPDCAYPVGYALKPVGPGEYSGVDGQDADMFWADPDLDEAAAHMRRVHQHPKAARALGLKAQARVEEKYGPRTVGGLMLQELGITPFRAGPPGRGEAGPLPPDGKAADAKAVRRPRRKRPNLVVVRSGHSME